jgi:2-oxo-4-hydroxy-4-carboxy--5-ureidoimidazoline (OHCU) decarboxylase
MPYTLPSVQRINDISPEEQEELLNNLFEPHSAIVSYLSSLFQSSYESYTHFIEAAYNKFRELDPQSPLVKEIISSHPRLGLPRGTELSEHSSKEQESLQGDDTVKEFIQLNSEYESKYPGLRFVLFVNGRDREQVKKFFKQRIARGDYDLEVLDAIRAMCDIAQDRVNKLEKQRL